jgi:hypothetical protein
MNDLFDSGGKDGGGEMRNSRKRADSDVPVPVRKRKDGGIVMIL